MPFQFQRLDIPDVLLIEPRTFQDQRGFFMETYKRSDFVANGITEEFVQSNYSHSIRGTLRGLHFQKHPQAQDADQDPGDTRHKAIGFVMTTFQKLAASSTRAIKGALGRRLVGELSLHHRG